MKVNFIKTTYENNEACTTTTHENFVKEKNNEFHVLNIYPDIEYQEFHGFGGAITDASGYVYSQMNEENKKSLIEKYFGESGNCYKFVRTHIDSCDFSTEQYEAMSDENDKSLTSFSLNRDEKYIIPLLKAAQSKTSFELLLSPWSPPAFMKSNKDRAHGGSLLPEYRRFWANYICKYVKEYLEKGFDVTRITIQNEPLARQTWDSCIFSAEEEKVFLRDFLYPALKSHGLEHIKINIWDHNKERAYERACEIIDEETNEMVSGIAFHFYTGDHFEAIALVRDKFPDKELIFTEGCVEYSRYSKEGQLEKAHIYAHEIIGNINAGMNVFIDWNILLDEQGGPNYVQNFCDAPMMYNAQTETLVENLSFKFIGHFSKYIKPGAKRIAFSKHTSKLEVCTFKNVDGSIVAVLLNVSAENVDIHLRLNGEVVGVNVPANSILTAVIVA